MVFVETPLFTAQLRTMLDDDEYRALQLALGLRPDQGALIRGSGGLRKVDGAYAADGSVGGGAGHLLLGNGRGDDHDAASLYKAGAGGSDGGAGASARAARAGGVQVKTEAFTALLESVRQAGRIRRGTLRPGRRTVFKPADVKAVRAKLQQSQAEFALMIGVSVSTLRNWEQGRRTPDGPALALLRVAARDPQAVVAALHGAGVGARAG